MSHGILTGDNLIINGGTYILHNNVPTAADSKAVIPQPELTVAQTQARISFDKLAGKAFPLAFHLADTDRSHSTCFPNTRTKILERIKTWALRSEEKYKAIMWLHGAAGGGKTSIARTFARWCDEDQGILLGEFFFSRANGTGTQYTSFAPTIAFRMAVHTLEDAKDDITKAITRDPHIFSAPLAYQLRKLVLEPLDIFIPNGITPHVIILDGLDETLTPDEQETFLNVLSTTVYQHNPTLRILVCSRTEPTIATAFNDTDSALNTISFIVSLNDETDSDADIRRFLVERFAKIKKQLPFTPEGEWPTMENIDYLVAKSSGQFIYAATVEKYVGSPEQKHLAITRLKHVLDLSTFHDPAKYPFGDLDALYSLILSTRNDDKLSARTMAICIQYANYVGVISPQKLARILGLQNSEIFEILYELGSLLDVGNDYIKPFHASFGDFIFDKSRSHDFYCGEGDTFTDIACSVLEESGVEAPSYELLYHLMVKATHRSDLRRALSRPTMPYLVFGRYTASQNPEDLYYLIPVLRQIIICAVCEFLIPRAGHKPDLYDLKLARNHESFLTYFDESFTKLLYDRTWNNVPLTRHYLQGTNDVTYSNSRLAYENVTEHDLIYPVTRLAPLIRSSDWDDVKGQVKNSLEGPAALRGLCDEPKFVRSYLRRTSATILSKWSPASDAIFCLKQITSADIEEDICIKFAKLLQPSLGCAERWPILLLRLEDLLAKPTICQKLPAGTMEAIKKFLNGTPSSVYYDPEHPEPITSSGPKVSTASGSTPTSTSPTEDSSINGSTQLQYRPRPIQRRLTAPASNFQPILSTSPAQSLPQTIQRNFTAPALYAYPVIPDTTELSCTDLPGSDVPSEKSSTANAAIAPEPTQAPIQRAFRSGLITSSKGKKPSITSTHTPPRRTTRETANTSAHPSSAHPSSDTKIPPRHQPRPMQRQFLAPESDSRRPTPSPTPSNGGSQKDTSQSRRPATDAKPTSRSKHTSSIQSSSRPAARNPSTKNQSSPTSDLKNHSITPAENRQPASITNSDVFRNATPTRKGKGKEVWK